ncbi:MAG: DUF4838 domain-containing protein [Micromonosporaceae bacterium]
MILARGAATDYVIRVGAGEGVIVRHAAQELADYLGQITGATFPIDDSDAPLGDPSLIVGQDNDFAVDLCPELADQAFSDDGFVLCAAGEHLVVSGDHQRGTLYAVYWLLDRELGVRWWGPDHTFVPSNPDLVLTPSEVETVQEPRFAYREIFSGDSEAPEYRQHNLLNGRSHHRMNLPVPPEVDTWSAEFEGGHHSFHTVVPDAAYHAGGQLAAMHDQTRAIAASVFTSRLTNDPDRLDRYNNLSQMDRGWSPDPASRAFADAHGGALSAPVIDMVTDVAARTRATHPQARFGTLAYQWSFEPPQGLTVPEHVQVVVAPIHADFAKSRTGAGNAEIAADITDWNTIAPNLVVWDYLTNFGAYIQPHPIFDGLFETIQGLAGQSHVRGYFGQDSYSTVGVPFAELRAWVSARLLWNPDQDYQALVDEFVNGYYRAAAPQISQYLTSLRDSVTATGSRLVGVQIPVTADYLTFDTMRQADDLFVAAEAAVAGDAAALRHVQTARIGVDYVILLRRAEYAAEAAGRGIVWDPDTAARLTRFQNYIAQTGMTRHGEGVGTLDELYAAMQVERTSPVPPPDFVADLPDNQWRDFSDLMLSRFGATIAADAKASDGAAVRLRGDTNVWGIQLRDLALLPDDGSRWKLYPVVRIDPGDGARPPTAP